jgi:predicted ribosomally synthesized peptide with nif11-like leader
MGINDFLMRMRTDRAFRGRLLAIGKDGFEAALQEEGYEFTTDELKESLPQVHTGLRAGMRGAARDMCLCSVDCTPCGCGD